jgi:hypothetical protein
MSLHAGVAVPARDRPRLERLCRYVARPPLANERLEARADGSLSLRLKTRWRDGTTHILMERRELIERLVPLIPPPRAHQVRYHGILAPCASYRDQVVPGALVHESSGEPAEPSDGGPDTVRLSDLASRNPDARLQAAPRDRARRIRWASLLQRVFEIDALRCPRCGSTLRLIAAIEDPTVASKILGCLKLPARAPPHHPAHADAAHADLHADDDFFDQSPADDDP